MLEPQTSAPWLCLSTYPHVGTSYKQQQSPTSGSPARITRRIQSVNSKTPINPQAGLFFRQDGSGSSSQFVLLPLPECHSPSLVRRPAARGRPPPHDLLQECIRKLGRFQSELVQNFRKKDACLGWMRHTCLHFSVEPDP